MRCEEVRPLIHSYLDGELDLARSTEIDRHFDICHICTRDAPGRARAAFCNSRARSPTSPRRQNSRNVSG